MSVFGRLSFQAPVVEQGGIVRAPFGTLSFGTNYPATSRVDLLPGSLELGLDGGADLFPMAAPSTASPTPITARLCASVV